jgi:hypothetical protein
MLVISLISCVLCRYGSQTLSLLSSPDWRHSRCIARSICDSRRSRHTVQFSGCQLGHLTLKGRAEMPPSAHNHLTGEITDVMPGTVNALITGYRNAAAF